MCSPRGKNGLILTGTHLSIVSRENMVSNHAKTLANCVRIAVGEEPSLPVRSCNQVVVTLRIPEFFEVEEQGVAPSKVCKSCSGCKECSFRGITISREKEAVVKRVSYPWMQDIQKLSSNVDQVIAFQSSIEKKLLKDPVIDEECLQS